MIGEPGFEQLLQRITELEHNVLQPSGAEDYHVWEKVFNRPLVDSLPAGLAFYDNDLNLLMHNQSYHEFLRVYSPVQAEHYVGLNHYYLKPGSKGFSEELFRFVTHARSARTCYDFHLEIDMGPAPQGSFWDVHLSPVTDSRGSLRGLLMFCLDLTHRKLARQVSLAGEGWDEAGEAGSEELKAALRTVLRLREEEKQDSQERLLSRMNSLVLPYIERLKSTSLDPEQKTYLQILESNLSQLLSPDPPAAFSTYSRLTPRELEIADLIRDGKTSKTIAHLLRVSKANVEFHRLNIRKKLRLDNQKVNLRSYLLAMGRC
ncbi:MAG: LuxR C-terminal-related transcriptional regulator [Deltaproteobacteria bacterium]|nr:LuxR C-terminal-related transcriptional regulator [Deltaproteobacteria bacterium]